MPDTEFRSQGTQPPPTGHSLPRRTSPGSSVTLRHHRLARDASLLASAGSAPAHMTDSNSNPNSLLLSSRRNSSGESHDTGQSDPKKWFDQSNQNPTAIYDSNSMDVDPPFYQKESDSSNEDKPYPYQRQAVPPKLNTEHSSSNDDYRSVIDDLTVEIQKLKEELRRYKQNDPDMLRKEKLFEIKIHGLPKRKKRELETTLREFAASLEGSPDAFSSQHKNSRQASRDQMYSASGGSKWSKHASSSPGSNNRPADSAYASMSTGAHSSGTSLGRPLTTSRAKSSEQKVESYLRDIPEGLYPRHMVMTDKDKKKLVVRRLEQLFTGKIGGRHFRQDQIPSNQLTVPGSNSVLAPVMSEGQNNQHSMMHHPPSLVPEPVREARILPPDQQGSHSRKKSRSRDNGSASNSNGDQTESGGNGNSSGGTNVSPSMPPPPEQRPTRPKDLDPDRVQVPSENMEYIRHLGLVPPELLGASGKAPEVNADAEGWVYLNLLCNLAQLHIINVTPDFVRSAVADISTKFQMSPDGRKIRWRGGIDGTRIASDSSGDNSHRSPETDDTDSKDSLRKKRKIGQPTGDEDQSGRSSKNPSKFGPQILASSESFHYKPLFVRHDSSNGETSPEDTLSSLGPVDDSNFGESRLDLSGSGMSNRRKRRHDGAIIYYNGAPFCTDLSGDLGDVSPTTYMLSSTQAQAEPTEFVRPPARRSESGSSLPYRPLTDLSRAKKPVDKMQIDSIDNVPGLTTDAGEDSTDMECDFAWTDDQQYIEIRPLEPCGLGGVLPDDHFMVVVTTKRPKDDARNAPFPDAHRANTKETTDGMINRLATMSTAPSMALTSEDSSRSASPAVEIEYLSGRIKRLAPVPLPPPAIFFPPFSSGSSGSDDDDLASDDDDEEMASAELTSRRANPHQSDDYPDGVDLTSGDEDGEDPDDESDARRMYESADRDNRKRPQPRRQSTGSTDSAEAAAGTVRGRSKSASADVIPRGASGSSAATAGGVDSGFSTGDESS